jgi:hypothetical protein
MLVLLIGLLPFGSATGAHLRWGARWWPRFPRCQRQERALQKACFLKPHTDEKSLGGSASPDAATVMSV